LEQQECAHGNVGMRFLRRANECHRLNLRVKLSEQSKTSKENIYITNSMLKQLAAVTRFIQYYAQNVIIKISFLIWSLIAAVT
jgi:hypothetical protein